MHRFVIGLLLAFLFAGVPMVTAIAADADIAKEDITFQSGGVTLSGTIYRPEKTVAALVLVHGSGQEKRMNGFATLLARQGIATLTYDKRGVGESGGVYAGPEVGTNNIGADNLALLATDASAAIDALSAKLPKTHGDIGLLGFSQAGWIIPLAAEKNPKVKFMVMFSGPVATAREQLRFQFYTESKPDFWDTHSEADARQHIANDADRYDFPDTDPRTSLAKLTIRGLWLFGGKDVQAPVQLSTERLDALKAQHKPYAYRVFPTLTHNTSSTRTPAGEEAVATAVQWIKSGTLNAPPRQ